MARTQYIWDQKNRMITGYSLKAGSTTIMKSLGVPRAHIGQFEALKHAERGLKVRLFVRHPLDRLVSAWKFFTTVGTSYIKAILDRDPKAHNRLMARDCGFEEWADIALKWYNPHWYPQTEYHTTKEGLFVPTDVYELSYLSKTKMNSTRHEPWEFYYEGNPELRAKIEDMYINDIVLYELAKEAGEDGFNTRTRDVFRQSRRDVWHDGLAAIS